MRIHSLLPWWSVLLPLLACALLAVAFGVQGLPAILMLFAVLVGAVVSAVHHAEVIAHRIGEPFGTLLLAVAVTVIEVALIISMMISSGDNGGAGGSVIARDTVFAAIMIVCNGVVGLCVLLGGLRHRELVFRVEGTNPALAVLVALSALTLVLPLFTTTTPGPTFSESQLTFAGLCSLVLYGTFVFVQTMRHREYFLPAHVEGTAADDLPHERPSNRHVFIALGLLMFALVGVVGLAKSLSPSLRIAIQQIGATESAVGIAISLMVLMPESVAAVRAALANRFQTSLNLALGSALASIGLTIPAVAMVSIVFNMPLTLGLNPTEMLLLAVTLLLSVLTLGLGKTTVLQGVVHLVILAAYLFLSLVP